MDLIGDIASIATLLLFGVYFIGRIITILSIKPIWNDKIVYAEDATDVVEEFKYDDSGYGMAITSSGLIRNMKIYEAVYDQRKGRFVTGNLLLEKNYLREGQSILVWAETPDACPKLIVEYETMDYLKVSFYWVDNLKNGVMSEIPKVSHTFKSVLYCLCR